MMAMIRGVDAGTLFAAFDAGRGHRRQDEKAAEELRDAAAKRARQAKIDGLIGQMFGDKVPTVESQFAPTKQPQTFAEAFTPEGIAEAGPSSAPMVAPSRAPNPDVLRQLVILDPETGGKIATAFKSMDEAQIKRMEARNMALGAAAHWLSKMPEAERRASFPIVEQHLAEAGWTPEELAQANLTDRGLQAYLAQSMDLDKIIDNEMAEREFNAGKAMAVVPGGNVAVVKPDGSAKWAIGGGAQQPEASSIPQAAADYLKQNPNLRGEFDAKYGAGAAERILGGGGGNATGGFP